MIQENISRSEAKITWSLFLVCFCYFIFVLPITFIHEVHGYVHLVGLCIYWLQYSLNFIIYAARIEQYRKAYILFLGEVVISTLLCYQLIIRYWFLNKFDSYKYLHKKNIFFWRLEIKFLVYLVKNHPKVKWFILTYRIESILWPIWTKHL